MPAGIRQLNFQQTIRQLDAGLNEGKWINNKLRTVKKYPKILRVVLNILTFGQCFKSFDKVKAGYKLYKFCLANKSSLDEPTLKKVSGIFDFLGKKSSRRQSVTLHGYASLLAAQCVKQGTKPTDVPPVAHVPEEISKDVLAEMPSQGSELPLPSPDSAPCVNQAMPKLVEGLHAEDPLGCQTKEEVKETVESPPPPPPPPPPPAPPPPSGAAFSLNAPSSKGALKQRLKELQGQMKFLNEEQNLAELKHALAAKMRGGMEKLRQGIFGPYLDSIAAYTGFRSNEENASKILKEISHLETLQQATVDLLAFLHEKGTKGESIQTKEDGAPLDPVQMQKLIAQLNSKKMQTQKQIQELSVQFAGIESAKDAKYHIAKHDMGMYSYKSTCLSDFLRVVEKGGKAVQHEDALALYSEYKTARDGYRKELSFHIRSKESELAERQEEVQATFKSLKDALSKITFDKEGKAVDVPKDVIAIYGGAQELKSSLATHENFEKFIGDYIEYLTEEEWGKDTLGSNEGLPAKLYEELKAKEESLKGKLQKPLQAGNRFYPSLGAMKLDHDRFADFVNKAQSEEGVWKSKISALKSREKALSAKINNLEDQISGAAKKPQALAAENSEEKKEAMMAAVFKGLLNFQSVEKTIHFLSSHYASEIAALKQSMEDKEQANELSLDQLLEDAAKVGL